MRSPSSYARLDVVVTFITEQTLRKTRHFNGPLRALAARASTGGCCLVLVIGDNYCKATSGRFALWFRIMKSNSKTVLLHLDYGANARAKGDSLAPECVL